MSLSYVAVGPICASSPDLDGNIQIWNSTAYRALQLGIRALPTVGSLLWPKSSLDKNYFVVTKLVIGEQESFYSLPLLWSGQVPYVFLTLDLSPFKLQDLECVEYRNRYNALLAAYCLDSELRLGILVVHLVYPTPVDIMVVCCLHSCCLVSSRFCENASVDRRFELPFFLLIP